MHSRYETLVADMRPLSQIWAFIPDMGLLSQIWDPYPRYGTLVPDLRPLSQIWDHYQKIHCGAFLTHVFILQMGQPVLGLGWQIAGGMVSVVAAGYTIFPVRFPKYVRRYNQKFNTDMEVEDVDEQSLRLVDSVRVYVVVLFFSGSPHVHCYRGTVETGNVPVIPLFMGVISWCNG